MTDRERAVSERGGGLVLRATLNAWRARWADWRNRKLQDPQFQRWASKFPLTRARSRREAREIFDLVAGFIYSQTLLGLVRSQVLIRLRSGPRSQCELQSLLAMSAQAAETLLKAGATLELLEHRAPDHWALGPKGAALLGNPGVLAMIEHHAVLYRDLADPLALLRAPRGATELARYWPYATERVPGDSSTARIAHYTELMATSQGLVAAEILDAYDFSQHRCVLDVGGGDGSFLRSLHTRHPGLELKLFDLPAVIEVAAERLQGLNITAHAGDFTRDELPMGADLVTLVRILHDHDDARALQLLRAIRRVVPDSATILIAEPLADTRGAERVGHPYFGFYLFAMGSGRPRTIKEIGEILEKTGFSAPRLYPTHIPLQTSVLTTQPIR
jgi:demethylspheroidene O-methyltransferase